MYVCIYICVCIDCRSFLFVVFIVDHNIEETEDKPSIQLSSETPEDNDIKMGNENGNAGDNRQSFATVFRLAALLGKRNSSLSDLSEEDQALFIQELSLCHWFGTQGKCGPSMSDDEMVQLIINGIRDAILKEIQDSPYFSLITDKPLKVANTTRIPVFVRYVGESTPKVQLMGFLPFDENCDADVQANKLAKILTEDWGLPMAQCRGQAFLYLGAGYQSLKKMSLDFLKSYPLAVITPSESCGLAHWLAGCVPCPSVAKMLDIVEDLLVFFDESPCLEEQLSLAVDGLLNMPREALEEFPETCCSKWKKGEDFFDILVDTLDGILSCLDNVSATDVGSKSIRAQVLSSALRNVDFVVTLTILKNACAPLRNCSTVFRCGNPSDILCEVEKIPPLIETLNKMLENVNTLHSTWFEQGFQLATKVAPEQVYFSEEASSYESPEAYYRETLSIPLLRSLIDEMKYSFSDDHLKALSVLSLLPSCNPIMSESTDKPFSHYLQHFAEPGAAEQEINEWASVWQDKYQDVPPPTSIAETLVHPESKSHPTVAFLLRLVAVLPSVGMECDLMKTILNSTRGLLKNTVCKGNLVDQVMLLSHCAILQRLPEVIEKCVEVDQESAPCLSLVRREVFICCFFK